MACGTLQSKHTVLSLAGDSELSPQVGEGALWDEGPSTQD